MVSDFGRVYSHVSQKFLRPGIASNGYPTVRLTGKKTRTVHSLVADAFIGLCPTGMEVRHRDGDRTNPALSNLLYGTPTQNREDQYRHGTRSKKTDLEIGRKTRDSKLASDPDYFVKRNRQGTQTKNARYGKIWSALAFTGEKFKLEHDL